MSSTAIHIRNCAQRRGVLIGMLMLAAVLFTLKSYDGREANGELMTLKVPERRDVRGSQTIDVAVVRLFSRATKPGAPIVFLSGGPGVPATAIARVPPYFTLFDALREHGDVLLLDQRGSGMSSPQLTCPETELPGDFLRSDEALRRALLNRASDCAKHWRAQGVDLTGYSTREIANDVDALRRALGVPKVKLLAFSYGSEVALELARTRPKSVERVVFASTRGPDHLLKLASVWDARLEALGIRDDVDAAVARLDAEPLDGTLGGIALLTVLRNDFPKVPDDATLRAKVQQLRTNIEKSFNLMTLAVDCASGWSPARLERARAEAAKATMRNVNLQWDPEVCAAIRPPATPPRLRKTSVPALFITGANDVNAPPAQAESVKAFFRNASHEVIDDAGHETLPMANVQTLVRDFLAGRANEQR